MLGASALVISCQQCKLTDDDSSCFSQPPNGVGVTGRDGSLQSKTPCRSVHAVFNARGDVVLDANRYAVQDASDAARSALRVEFRCLLERSRRGRNHSVQQAVDLLGPSKVSLRSKRASE